MFKFNYLGRRQFFFNYENQALLIVKE